MPHGRQNQVWNANQIQGQTTPDFDRPESFKVSVFPLAFPVRDDQIKDWNWFLKQVETSKTMSVIVGDSHDASIPICDSSILSFASKMTLNFSFWWLKINYLMFQSPVFWHIPRLQKSYEVPVADFCSLTDALTPWRRGIIDPAKVHTERWTKTGPYQWAMFHV